MSVLKINTKMLVIITNFLARQNEGENHMKKLIFDKNCTGFCHDSLLHVRDRALKMAIFGLEKPWISSAFVLMNHSLVVWISGHIEAARPLPCTVLKRTNCEEINLHHAQKPCTYLYRFLTGCPTGTLRMLLGCSATTIGLSRTPGMSLFCALDWSYIICKDTSLYILANMSYCAYKFVPDTL